MNSVVLILAILLFCFLVYYIHEQAVCIHNMKNINNNLLNNIKTIETRVTNSVSTTIPSTIPSTIPMVTSIYKNICDTYGQRGSNYVGNSLEQSDWCLVGIVYAKGGEKAMDGSSMNLYAQYYRGDWRYKVVDHVSGTHIFIYDYTGTGMNNTLANNDVVNSIPSKGGPWKTQIVNNYKNLLSKVYTPLMV